jgi:hypothetical protein
MRFPIAPTRFDGSLEEFYDRWVTPALASSRAVEEFHASLVSFLASDDPVHLVRMVKGTPRGVTIRNGVGGLLRATDNAPAWYVHRALFTGDDWKRMPFAAFIDGIPCHMFDLGRTPTISGAGWHVAHIIGAKNRDVQFEKWDRQELRLRMLKNLHPCNFFFVPKQNWQRVGSDREVIAFFASRFAERYRSVWSEFLSLVDGHITTSLDAAPSFSVGLETNRPPKLCVSDRSPTTPPSGSSVIFYQYSRLCFKANIIEPLRDDEIFRVVTPVGTFELTKGQFYAAFPNVVRSASYRDRGIYHFPSVPRVAERFRIDVTPDTSKTAK